MCMICPAAFAGDDYSKYELFFGYSLLKIGSEYDDIDDERDYLNFNDGGGFKKSNFLEKGFTASFTYNFTSIAGVETAFRYNSGYILSEKWKEFSYYYTENHERGYKRRDIALLIGPRLTFRSGAIAPFVHGLVGLSHDRVASAYDIKYEDFYGNRDSASDSETLNSNTSLGVALGGGLDILVSDNIAIRAIQADYYMANHPKNIYHREYYDTYTGGNKMFSNVNLSFGVVIRFGR